MSSHATQPNLHFINRHGRSVEPGTRRILDRASIHVAFKRARAVLLIRPFFAPSMLECVGGGIHPGETLIDAAQRETLEEIDERIDFRRLTPTAVFRSRCGWRPEYCREVGLSTVERSGLKRSRGAEAEEGRE